MENIDVQTVVIDEFKSLRAEIAEREKDLQQLKNRALIFSSIGISMIYLGSIPFISSRGIDVDFTKRLAIPVSWLSFMFCIVFAVAHKNIQDHIMKIGEYVERLEIYVYGNDSHLGWERFLRKEREKNKNLNPNRFLNWHRNFWTLLIAINIGVLIHQAILRVFAEN